MSVNIVSPPRATTKLGMNVPVTPTKESYRSNSAFAPAVRQQSIWLQGRHYKFNLTMPSAVQHLFNTKLSETKQHWVLETMEIHSRQRDRSNDVLEALLLACIHKNNNMFSHCYELGVNIADIMDCSDQ